MQQCGAHLRLQVAVEHLAVVDVLDSQTDLDKPAAREGLVAKGAKQWSSAACSCEGRGRRQAPAAAADAPVENLLLGKADLVLLVDAAVEVACGVAGAHKRSRRVAVSRGGRTRRKGAAGAGRQGWRGRSDLLRSSP